MRTTHAYRACSPLISTTTRDYFRFLIISQVQEIKTIQHQLSERDAMHQEELAKVRKKVEQAWRLYESVKSRAERRTAEFSEAAEKLKASQGYLLDLWQTLKTVDTVVEANEHDEL